MEPGLFDHRPDPLDDTREIGRDWRPQDLDATQLRPSQPQDRPKGGRLAGAVGTEESGQETVRELEGDIGERDHVPVGLADPEKLDRGMHGSHGRGRRD
jgi:hypothetical protein